MKNMNPVAMAVAVALYAVPAASMAQDDDDEHHGMDHIVVTATPLERTVENLAQPASVLHGDELAKKQSTSIGETLAQEPGLSSTYFGPVSSRPVIRGQYGERVRVLANGLDSLDASALSEDHQVAVEGLLADRIEIIRGPATLLYGSGAAGGLVNVIDSRIADRLPDETISGGIALGAASATGNRDAAGRAQIGAGSFVISADFFARETDNIEIPGFAESRYLMALEEEEHEEHEEEHEEDEEAFGKVENTESETYGGAIGASLVGDNGFLGVSVNTFNSKYGVPGHAHHHEEEHAEGEEEPLEEEEEAVRIDLEQLRVDVIGEYEFGGSLIDSVRVRAAVNDYEHIEFEGAEVGTTYKVKGADGRVELRHAKIAGLEGAVGLQFKTNDLDAIGDEAYVPASETQRTSVFVFEELVIDDMWTLQGSARFENQTIKGPTITEEYDDGAFGASLGVLLRPADNFRISANVARTERHPTATELYADGPHVAVQRYERGSVTLGNGLLKKEKSTNLDITLHGDAGVLEWSLTGFVNKATDYIVLRPTDLELDEFQVYDYDQADVEFRGIEAEARIELYDNDSGHMHLRMFTDYVDASEDESGAKLPRIPPRRLGFGLHGGWGAIDASIDATIASRQDDIAENELPTDGYTLLDAGISYTFDEPDIYVFLKGTNLLDEEIRRHASPLKDLVPLPGRSIQLGLRYEF